MLFHVTQRNHLPLDIYTGYYLIMIPQVQLQLLLTITQHILSITLPQNSLHLMVLNIYIYPTSMLYISIHMPLQTNIPLFTVVPMVDCVVMISVLSRKFYGQLVFRV